MRWVQQIFTGVVLAVVAVAVIVPRLAGATPYVVLTGSMRPSMPPGTMVVDRAVDPTSLSIGDVVTYQERSGEPIVVTHRIVGIGFDGRGGERFVTQGDANPVADAALVRPEQIRGERWYSVPYLGYATSLVSSQVREAVSTLLVVLLLGYAVAMFAGAARARAVTRSEATS